MKKTKNKSLILVLSIMFAVSTLLVGTFAWFTAQDAVTNHLSSGSMTNGYAKIVEVFDEDEPLNPGTTVDKLVGVVNTGASDAFVRISFAEALKKLDNNGDPVRATAVYDGTAGIIPQLFSAEAIAAGGAYGSWTVITADITEFEAASLAEFLEESKDIEVRYNKTIANGKTFYQFVAYAPISGTDTEFDGSYQVVVDLAIAVVDDEEILLDGSFGFMQFVQTAETNAKWSALANTAFAGYTDTLGTPVVTLPDTTSHVDAMLSLTFGVNVKTNIAACTAGDWWYCEDDGYFYYIGKLASGAQTANWLLEGVALDADADNSFCNLSYDLTPCMDGIQAVPEALTSATGWNLDATLYSALISALTA